MEKILKKTGWTAVLTSAIFILIGVLICANPEGIAKFISYVLGIVIIIVGITKVFNYFVARGKVNIYNFELIYGIIAMVIGVVLMVYSTTLGTIFRIMIGIWIIYSSLMRINLGLKLKEINSKAWSTVLGVACIMLVCGLYVTLKSGAIMTTIGIVVIIYAVMDLIESTIFVKNVNDIM